MPRIWIDDRTFEISDGITAAAALQHAGSEITRWSVNGRPRAPLCGMGVCFECRVEIDGVRRLACQTAIREGMRIVRSHQETP